METKEEKISNEKLAELIESVAVNLANFQEETKGFQSEMRAFQSEMISFRDETRSAIRELREDVQELHGNVRDLRRDVNELQEGAFAKDEKEDLMGMVRHINQRLVHEAHGEKDITLTREEYDAASRAQGFPNRYNKPKEIVVD
jgi:Sec-independent protein translocase protein TatA